MNGSICQTEKVDCQFLFTLISVCSDRETKLWNKIS